MKILIYVNSNQNLRKIHKLGGIEILNYSLFKYLKAKHYVVLQNYLNKRIKETKWDIIISSNDANIFNYTQSSRKILWLHNKLQIEKAYRKKQLIPILSNNIEAVFVSKYLNQNTSRIYNFNKRLVIPNFLPPIFENFNISKKIKTNKNLFVWSVQREKGLKDLIKIWIKKIYPLNLNTELHVFLKNKNKSKYKKFNIFFHKKLARNKLLSFYKRSTGMICLGYDETFCLNAVEAMKMGMPVFSLGKTALNELIVCRKNGFKVNKIDEIDKPIVKFLNLNILKKKKIIKSSANFAKKFHSKKIFKKWDNLINNKKFHA